MLDLHNENVFALAFQPGTSLLASAASDGWLFLWRAAGEPIDFLEGANAGFSCLSWQPHGQQLAAGGQSGELLAGNAKPDYCNCKSTNASWAIGQCPRYVTQQYCRAVSPVMPNP